MPRGTRPLTTHLAGLNESITMTRTLLSYERNDTNLTLLLPSPLSSFSDQEIDEIAANEHLLLLTRFVVQKLCVPLVVLVGVIGNFLSVVVLTRKCMNSSTNSYLTALAVFDLLYLLFSFYLSLKHHQVFKHSPTYIYCFRFARVFTDMFANVSVILTVTFTLERYIGVCHPMKGRILCTVQRAKVITLAAASIAILCTSPEFWEMEVTWVVQANQSVPVVRYTDFANQPSYAVGYYWFLVVIFTLLPLTLLCVFNGILIITVVRAAEMRKQMTLLTPVSSTRFLHGRGSEGPNNSRVVACQPREQQKITKILITVVIVFIVCQIPGALLLLYKTYTALGEIHLTREQQNNLKIAGNVINLLIQINASINFILYSAISTKFRRVFYHIVCNRKKWCYRRCHLWYQSTFSRSDVVKMSSLYGDRKGSKLTSYPAYTCKAKLSQRSIPHSSSRNTGMTPQPDLFGVLVQRPDSKRQQKANSFHLTESHKYDRLLKSRARDGSNTCMTWSKRPEDTRNCFVNDVVYSQSDESILGSLWPCSKESNCSSFSIKI